MPITMYDSVTISNIPAHAQAVAGYVGGLFPTYSRLVEDFPQAKHLSIAVNAREDAECLDVEAGDATPAQAPAWVARQHARGVLRPVLYASASEMPSVIAALDRAGIGRSQFRVWTAHFTDIPHIEPGSDATQWHGGVSVPFDTSLCVDDFFGEPPTPKPIVNPAHYDWFDNTPRRVFLKQRRERGQVELYDKLRAKQTPKVHPRRLQLNFVRLVLRWFAGRVAHVSLYDSHDKKRAKPEWDTFHRGWRYQQLIHRAQGQRFV